MVIDEQPESQGGPASTERLWAPWRMAYVGGLTKNTGCLFCSLPREQDAETFVAFRSASAFVMLNRYPYNSGHVMIVPTEHTSAPDLASDESIAAMAKLLPVTLKVLRAALNPHGFNVGMNVGADAGAGVSDHMHQHVVPRWQGDANFMPILANTMVMPELIPITYARIRAEFVVAVSPVPLEFHLIVFDTQMQSVLVEEGNTLPQIVTDDLPVQRAQERLLAQGVQANLIAWGGASTADSLEEPALAFIADHVSAASTLHWLPVNDNCLSADVTCIVERAIHR